MKNKNLFKINLIYFIAITLFVGLRIFSGLGGFNGLDSELASKIFTIIIQVGIMCLVPFTLYMIFFKKGLKKTFKFIGFKKISLKSVFIAIGIGCLAFVFNLIVSTVFNGIIGFLGYNPVTGGGTEYTSFFVFLSSLFFVAVLPGIFEEIAHRGFMLRSYIKDLGYKRALIYSSILFGLVHLNVGQVFYAIVMGFLIGSTAIVSGSIFPAMIVHFMNNAINVYLAYAMQNDLVGHGFYDGINSFLQNNSIGFTFITAFVFIAVLMSFISILILQLFKENKIKELLEVKEKVERSLGNEVFIDGIPTKEEIEQVNIVLSERLKPVLPNLSNVKSPVEIILPITEKDSYEPSIIENLFFYGSVFMGVLITIFTFIWGVL